MEQTNHDSVDLPASLTRLYLTDKRLSKLDPRIAHLSNLKTLSLRRNLFDDADVEPLSTWHDIANLEELIFQENQLKKVPDVSIFRRLIVLDISHNEISSLEGLSKVSNTLVELEVSYNGVAKMDEIEHFEALQTLGLGSNKLQVMENLQNLTNLEELWLGRNRIKTVNLCGLKCIQKINLQNNQLTSMTGFEECVALEELYLGYNGIAQMEGLSRLINLRVLDVAANKLTEIRDIEKLTRLEELFLNDNSIASLDGIADAVAGSREYITIIYLKRNPCAESPNYVAVLKEIFPNIQQIDSQEFEY